MNDSKHIVKKKSTENQGIRDIVQKIENRSLQFQTFNLHLQSDKQAIAIGK
ncbi:hypothetical protein P872_06290 [Rhodonellum psychrophilum GCM71 = DSM 17998]|uniref:Uncharacterized protein n=1 Tax=Rhodonellum psychrophilum GCM71 = DSM 17998 TaxID=1123057 RepID=U5BZT2_9BACT|nr:hypothetical protein P872_06290 [Rhodonellum psychrophilum GCM71 = DSM 17998]